MSETKKKRKISIRPTGFLWQKKEKRSDGSEVDCLVGYVKIFRFLPIRICIFYNKYKRHPTTCDWKMYLADDGG